MEELVPSSEVLLFHCLVPSFVVTDLFRLVPFPELLVYVVHQQPAVPLQLVLRQAGVCKSYFSPLTSLCSSSSCLFAFSKLRKEDEDDKKKIFLLVKI